MKKYIFVIFLVLTILLVGCKSAEEFTIIYRGNGNDYGYPPNDKNSYKVGDSAIVLGKNTLEKSASAFQHWNTKSDDTGNSYNAGDSITVNNTIFLYAVWD